MGGTGGLPKIREKKAESPEGEPKEASTQTEAEKPIAEVVTPAHNERKLTEYDLPKEFVEEYSLELALLYCQDEIDIKKLAEKYGSRHKRRYSFPELENSHINRRLFAQAVDHEGGVYINYNEETGRLYPSVHFSSTSKELAEKMMPLFCYKELPQPKYDKGHPEHAPDYPYKKAPPQPSTSFIC